MNCSLTINFIKENWCPATNALDRRSFCRAILPDSYDYALCRGQGDHFLNPDSPAQLAEQTLMGLMRGNRKSLKNLDFASTAFTKDFQQKLSGNSPIRYLDPNRQEETTVENMLGKIRKLVRQYCAPLDQQHMLFREPKLTTLGEGPEKPEYDRLELALHTLLARETEQSLTYALFLMIVAAILQRRLGTVQHLYAPETIDRVLNNDLEGPALEVESPGHKPFVDENYMHTYHVYFYRDSYRDSYRDAPAKQLWRGSLTMQLNAQKNRAVASMVLTSHTDSPISGEMELKRVFTGVPMLSRRDRMVYIGMTDERDTFAFLTFSHTRFNNAPMYFRSGLLISSAPESKYPIAQRVAIVARELAEDEMPYVLGLLKTGGKQLLLTEQQYRLFRETFRDYPWMADFEAHYAPLFEAHKKTVYCFNEGELLAWSIGDLSTEERLRILLALRSVDSGSNKMQDKFLESVPPTQTYTIMK